MNPPCPLGSHPPLSPGREKRAATSIIFFYSPFQFTKLNQASCMLMSGTRLSLNYCSVSKASQQHLALLLRNRLPTFPLFPSTTGINYV